MSDESLRTAILHNWIQRMRDGDDSAREELLQSVCERLERLARKMLRDFPGVKRWEQTCDVLQNALLRLLKALEKVDPHSVRDFYALAAVQIRRELLDLVRQYYGTFGMGTNQKGQLTQGDSQTTPVEAVAHDDGEDLDKWCAFHREVENLPAELREVVSLKFYHGWSQEEIAELLQVSLRTVRRYWQTAQVKLHSALKEN